MFLSWRMASGLSSFIVSATAMIPRSCIPSAKNSGVFPSEAKRSATSFVFSSMTGPMSMSGVEPLYRFSIPKTKLELPPYSIFSPMFA